MSARRRFPAVPASVAGARHFVLRELPGTDQEARERVELAVSELAANCVEHAVTDFEVSVTRDEDTVRIEVTDTGHGEPSIRRPDPHQQKGRGLQMVGAVADRWGVQPVSDRGGGKTVWFTLLTTSAGGTTGPDN
jgi:anti-sigma regulatory factor (Ser/Thr protein kinase)